MHDLRASLARSGARAPLRAFFAPLVPFQGIALDKEHRITAWPRGLHPDAAAATAAAAAAVTLPMDGPVRWKRERSERLRAASACELACGACMQERMRML
jgi:hypothetical protein